MPEHEMLLSSSDEEEEGHVEPSQLSFVSARRRLSQGPHSAVKGMKSLQIRAIRVGNRISKGESPKLTAKKSRRTTLNSHIESASNDGNQARRQQLPPCQKNLGVLQHVGSTQNETTESTDEVDMEVPYTQALGSAEEDEEISAFRGCSHKRKEPLRPGDVIMYYNPIFIAGKVEGLRKAHVLETDPDADFPLELDNGEYIPKDTTVKRIKEYRNGTLLEHPGISRPIENFRIMKRVLSAKDKTRLPTLRRHSERIGRIVVAAKTELDTLYESCDHESDKTNAQFQCIDQNNQLSSDLESSGHGGIRTRAQLDSRMHSSTKSSYRQRLQGSQDDDLSSSDSSSEESLPRTSLERPSLDSRSLKGPSLRCPRIPLLDRNSTKKDKTFVGVDFDDYSHNCSPTKADKFTKPRATTHLLLYDTDSSSEFEQFGESIRAARPLGTSSETPMSEIPHQRMMMASLEKSANSGKSFTTSQCDAILRPLYSHGFGDDARTQRFCLSSKASRRTSKDHQLTVQPYEREEGGRSLSINHGCAAVESSSSCSAQKLHSEHRTSGSEAKQGIASWTEKSAHTMTSKNRGTSERCNSPQSDDTSENQASPRRATGLGTSLDDDSLPKKVFRNANRRQKQPSSVTQMDEFKTLLGKAIPRQRTRQKFHTKRANVSSFRPTKLEVTNFSDVGSEDENPGYFTITKNFLPVPPRAKHLDENASISSVFSSQESREGLASDKSKINRKKKRKSNPQQEVSMKLQFRPVRRHGARR
jgi:hypothetical protein